MGHIMSEATGASKLDKAAETMIDSQGSPLPNTTLMMSTQAPPHVSNSFDCVLFALIGDGFVFLVICLIGVVGNSLSMLTFWPKVHENAMSLMLMSLAVVDTGVLVTYTFMISTPAFCIFFNTCSFYMRYVFMVLTAYFWPLPSALHLASTWHVTLVTFHRYLGVCHPHQFNRWTSMRQTRIQLLVICIASVLYNIPRFVDDMTKTVPGGGRYTIVKTKLGQSTLYGFLYNVGLYYLVIYAIPFASLMYMTIRLLKTLKESKIKKLTMTQAKKDEDDLTLTLVIVVLVYMICQVWNPIRRGLRLGLPYSKKGCGSIYFIFNYLTTLGILVNSAANFFIFCFCGKRFRRHLLQRLRYFRGNRVGAEGSANNGTNKRSGPSRPTQNTS